MKRARLQKGSVVFDKRRRIWNFLWSENGHRRTRFIGSACDFPTKTSAWRAAEPFRRLVENPVSSNPVNTVNSIVAQYRNEKMPERYSTRRAYECWLKKHVLPQWGHCHVTEVQARPVELWLQMLKLSPKSKSHIRGLLRILWDYAMWRGDVPTQRNPMELVTIKGASKRTRQPRSLAVDEFRRFVQHLEEPFRTMALLCVCFGLRVSECLALRFADIDWLESRLRIERGIVRQRVDDVKTIYSQRSMSIDAEMLEVLRTWRQRSRFSANEDWMFASPARSGRQPWSYDQVWRSYLKAGAAAGIGKFGTHSLRHSYRSWLDAVGTPIAVQQKLMRHSDIRTTMNIYGDVVTDEMAHAHSKVVGLALNRQLIAN